MNNRRKNKNTKKHKRKKAKKSNTIYLDDKKEKSNVNSNKNNLSYLEYTEKNINPDGNCFYRCISYYYRQTKEAYPEFRTLLYE